MRDRLGPILVFAPLFLLPFSRLTEFALILVAVWGLISLRDRHVRQFALRTAVPVFLLLWIPMMLSLLDASPAEKAWSTILGYWRFLPFAIGVAALLNHSAQWRTLRFVGGCLVMLWTLDVLVQTQLGISLLGVPLPIDRPNGVFGQEHFKLGPILAVLAALPLVAAVLSRSWWLAVVCWGLLALAVFWIGTRNAWVMFFLVTLGWLVTMLRTLPSGKKHWASLFVPAMVLMVVAVAWTGSEHLKQRWFTTSLLFSGDSPAISIALANRVPIWQTALEMWQSHPFNGIGVRGFSQSYAQYAGQDDPWVEDPGQTVLHPHQLLLELGSETGIIGVLGFFLIAGLLVKWWSRASAEQRRLALPYGLALLAWVFPINTHYAFYGTFSSIVMWWLLAVTLAALRKGAPNA